MIGCNKHTKKILQYHGITNCVKTLEAKTRANLPYREVYVMYLLS